ncbi:hypothetical protein NDU88_007093 [Pleurodeles waltl]|uniref:Uncharacterized protein n=1 Tax=Pleurodeles waltl TaxID=8319 RepID=A0AAV7N147_PLEWA|nr:hypothetical protein NDU88_007093 [Pleurodeles waltl]
MPMSWVSYAGPQVWATPLHSVPGIWGFPFDFQMLPSSVGSRGRTLTCLLIALDQAPFSAVSEFRGLLQGLRRFAVQAAPDAPLTLRPSRPPLPGASAWSSRLRFVGSISYG